MTDTTRDTTERVGALLREILDQPDLVVSNDLTASDVEGWDSVAHVELIFALEEEFGIEFSADEITSYANVGEMCVAIAKLRSD